MEEVVNLINNIDKNKDWDIQIFGYCQEKAVITMIYLSLHDRECKSKEAWYILNIWLRSNVEQRKRIVFYDKMWNSEKFIFTKDAE